MKWGAKWIQKAMFQKSRKQTVNHACYVELRKDAQLLELLGMNCAGLWRRERGPVIAANLFCAKWALFKSVGEIPKKRMGKKTRIRIKQMPMCYMELQSLLDEVFSFALAHCVL